MEADIFKDIDRRTVVVCYYDWTMISATFPASLEGAGKFLPCDSLIPRETTPGGTRVTVMAMEYRQMDRLEPYNEFGIMVPVNSLEKESAPGHPGFYVIHLPVTTREARDGGVFYFGYPKFLAEISFERSGDYLACQVRTDGKSLISLAVPARPGTLPVDDLYTYSVKDAEICKTRIEISGSCGRTTGPGASFRLGDHPLAEELKQLNIADTAVESQYAPHLKSILHHPSGIQPC